MNFDAFERSARHAFAQIPPEYRAGIHGLTVSRRTVRHPHRSDVFTLGECLTEAYPSGFDSAETVRSTVVLYWGSFQHLAADDPDFDWDGELWETLTHELKHHLESLASDDALEGVDAAMEEHHARLDGDEFDPRYYRSGEPVGENGFRFEDHLFIEQGWEGIAPPWVRFELQGSSYRVRVPVSLADIHYLVVEGLPKDASEVEIVLVRRRGWLEGLRSLVRGGGPSVAEAEVRCERMEGEEGVHGLS